MTINYGVLGYLIFRQTQIIDPGMNFDEIIQKRLSISAWFRGVLQIRRA